MSQYKRIVSYIYQYIDGEKGQNMGYLRLEQKAKQCRIVVQMKAVPVEIMPQVWLYRQRDTGIEYINIGKLSVFSGSLQCKVTTVTDNIFMSGHTASDFDGAIIYVNSKEYYATTWTDDSLFIGEIVNMSSGNAIENNFNKNNNESNNQNNNENNKFNKDASDNDERGNITENIVENIVDNIADDNNRLDNISADNTDNDNISNSDAIDNTNNDKSSRGVLADNADNNKSSKEFSADNADNNKGSKEFLADNADNADNNKSSKKVSADNAININISNGDSIDNTNNNNNLKRTYTNNADSNVSESIYANIVNDKSSNIKDTNNAFVKDYDMGGNDIEAAVQKKENDSIVGEIETQSICNSCPFKNQGKIDKNFGQRMLREFPVMYPFESGCISRSVKIEPKDLGCMPISLWALANNRFLLHGYYCYKHLIFAGLRDGGYAIGVPGVYSESERRSAAGYSFKGFQPIGSGKIDQGVFGYWLHVI